MPLGKVRLRLERRVRTQSQWHVNGTKPRGMIATGLVLAGGRYWVRTSDPSLVRRVLYH